MRTSRRASAENELAGEVLGVSWDGTGHGLDATVWGGEFLSGGATGFRRAAHLRAFRLPGGERAVREPRRSAIGVLFEMFGPRAFEMRGIRRASTASRIRTLAVLRQSLERGLNAPVTTSAGRLFDAVASLAGLRQVMAFEGQAAMMLEYAAAGSPDTGEYRSKLLQDRCECGRALAGSECLTVLRARARRRCSWWTGRPRWRASCRIARPARSRAPLRRGSIARLSEMVEAVALRCGLDRVVLTGGCFQNRLLLEGVAGGLRAAGFRHSGTSAFRPTTAVSHRARHSWRASYSGGGGLTPCVSRFRERS